MRVLSVEIRHVNPNGTVDDALPFQAKGAIQARHARARITHVDIERIAGGAIGDHARTARLGKGVKLAAAILELQIGLNGSSSRAPAVTALQSLKQRSDVGRTRSGHTGTQIIAAGIQMD